MTRTPWLLFGLALILLAQPVAGPAVAGNEEHRFTLDFTDASLEDVLRVLFQDRPYAFTLDPGLEDCRVTIILREVTFRQALRAILSMHDLTYRREEEMYHIFDAKVLPASMGELIVTVDLVEASLEDALRAVFEQTPYRYEFDYPEMLEELAEFGFELITAKLSDTSFSEALDGILGSHGLRYRQEGDLYRILWREPEPPPEAVHTPSADKFQMLYLTQYGGRHQLRLRVFPYPGTERVLWEGPDEPGSVWHLPSPSFKRVAILWGLYSYHRLFLLELDTRKVKEIAKEVAVHYLLWQDDETLRLLDYGGKEWTYDVAENKVVLVTDHRTGDRQGYDSEILSFFESAFPKEIDTLRKVIEEGKLAVPFDEDDVIGAIARGAGIAYRPSLAANIPVVFPVAAVSPDGRFLALTTGRSKYAVFVVHLVANHVWRVIPLTELVSDENAWVADLRWRGDSQYLTFTEVHYHPAQFYATDIGPRPDALDWTHLVRLYSLEGDRVQTVAVGSNAFLIPPSLQKPWYERMM
ncbi:MAG: STN domain-containing protein [Armatimonadota bacterium]|nr:STN domain-containing protein [Armatimonadota bacterium]